MLQLLALLFLALPVQAQPFKRALVIGGGGISPGVALGVIAGAQAAGYKPDVILSSCGSSLGAALYSSFGNAEEALAYAKSKKFYRQLSGMVKIDSRLALRLKGRLDRAASAPQVIPDLFQNTILEVPEDVTGLLPNDRFPTKGPKLIVLAAKALFSPSSAGLDPGPGPLYRETFITDAGTARLLRGRHSTVKENFPYSRVAAKTEAISGVSLSQAARASISDPYYLNPARIGDDYYFGGAVDLFPAETALELAEEVLMNFPTGLYSYYENLAIETTFGFSQSDRTTLVGERRDVKWLDTAGTIALSLDPALFGIFFVNKIPRTHAKYAEMIDKQFRFGYERAVHAVKAQRDRVNQRGHLSSTATGRR